MTAKAPPTAVDEGTLDRIVVVGALELHIHCEGRGKPIVVFEAGLGADARVWGRVQPEVAQRTRTCSYDRAGRGRSSPPPYPHGQQQMAKELRGLLQNVDQVPPYVLVGHSMGGAIVRWVQKEHADEVAGMVLLDAATEDWARHMLAQAPPEALPEFWRNLRAWEGLDQESLFAGYEGLRNSGQPLGARPLVVLTAGKPEADLPLRREAQAMLPRLSSNSVSVVVRDSGHNIQLDEPAVVVRAVQAVVDAARAGTRLDESSIQW